MIMLRALEPDDIDILFRIENDPEQWDVSPTTMPYSREFLKDYILSTTGDIFIDKQVRLVITTDDGTPIGLADLQNFDPKNRKAEIGLTVLPQYRNKGLATKALKELLDYALHTVHLHQVYAIAPADNISSQAMMLKCGFKQQSLLEDWLFNGSEYQNAILFQRFL